MFGRRQEGRAGTRRPCSSLVASCSEGRFSSRRSFLPLSLLDGALLWLVGSSSALLLSDSVSRRPYLLFLRRIYCFTANNGCSSTRPLGGC